MRVPEAGARLGKQNVRRGDIPIVGVGRGDRQIERTRRHAREPIGERGDSRLGHELRPRRSGDRRHEPARAADARAREGFATRGADRRAVQRRAGAERSGEGLLKRRRVHYAGDRAGPRRRRRAQSPSAGRPKRKRACRRSDRRRSVRAAESSGSSAVSSESQPASGNASPSFRFRNASTARSAEETGDVASL